MISPGWVHCTVKLSAVIVGNVMLFTTLGASQLVVTGSAVDNGPSPEQYKHRYEIKRVERERERENVCESMCVFVYMFQSSLDQSFFFPTPV